MSYISSQQIDEIMNDEISTKNLLGEEGFNFLIINYPEALSLYRLIIKEEKKVLEETIELRNMAKEELDKIRVQEENRRLTKEALSNKEKIELYAVKEYYKKLLETDGSRQINYKNKTLQVTPVLKFVLDNRKMFEKIEKIDQIVRNKFGFAAEKITKIGLWPMIKITKYVRKINTNKSAFIHLNEFCLYCEYLHIKVRYNIENPT